MKIEGITTPELFKAQGYSVKDEFLTENKCERLLGLIEVYRKEHSVPEVHRETRGRALYYKVIDGERIKQYLPQFWKLYQDVNQIVNEMTGQALSPLENERVGININITPRGGSYRWHYDRNAITGIVYLNEVAGGETECYPNYRVLLKKARYSLLQQGLDRLLMVAWVRRLFAKRILVKPTQGTLCVMRGNKCLHSVRPVEGDADRINVILSYDEPGANFAVAQNLDAYLYSQVESGSSDPNYR